MLAQPINDLDSHISDDPFSFMPGIMAVIGVVTASTEENLSYIDVYRHAVVHRCSKADQEYFNEAARCVELFVGNELGQEDPEEEEGKREKNNKDQQVVEENSETYTTHIETAETFLSTEGRKIRCQAFAMAYVRDNADARKIALAKGRNRLRTEEESYETFGSSARFQLQMRLRNRIKTVPQSQLWCVD